MGGIGKILGLQAEGPAFGIGRAVLPSGAAVQKISGIKLDTRECRQCLHQNTGVRRPGPGGGPQRAVPAQDSPVVVVFPPSNGLEFPQTHGRPLYRLDRPGGDQTAVHRGISVGQQLDVLPVNDSALMAGQVKIGMIG